MRDAEQAPTEPCFLCGGPTRRGRLCQLCARREYRGQAFACLFGILLGLDVMGMSLIGMRRWAWDPLHASVAAACGALFAADMAREWRKASRSRMYADRR